MTNEIQPGLLVLHGNRLEMLRDTVLGWTAAHPLRPLEEEIFLVQSNGAAEWLKMALADGRGVCAATRVELPARFLWRSSRQVLGRDAVPPASPLDKAALVWRLMRLLPRLAVQPAFAPIAAFLQDGAADRRLQLAERLADLFDQYQVYRADWLAAWAQGDDTLRSPQGQPLPLPDEQAWQPLLWRAALDELGADAIAGSRFEVQRRLVAALQALPAGAPRPAGLPRRVVLFGAAHVPAQTLQVLAALARHVQVIVAVPNPCRFHWADILDGRELLQSARRRQPERERGGLPLSALPLEQMHLAAHPLLAAWGRQGRDFMRALDVIDEAAATSAAFELPRIDLFDDGEGDTLLAQVQAAVRELRPLAEHPARLASPADRSIVFHECHSAQREVEVLHDALLDLLAAPPAPGAAPLQPRDIVVMVPDVESFAPAIRAVFGQYPREHPRHIPHDIADLRRRGSNPLVLALEWLLGIDTRRFRGSELRDLLDVPGIANRLGLADEDRARLSAWISGAGVRWGLHEAQRASLGLGACGDQNSWLFGLRRLLLGWAAGKAPAFDGIEPYDEVGGLEAGAVGALAALVERLAAWWALGTEPATPAQWAVRGRELLDALVTPVDERERLTLAALQAGLQAWLADCEQAGFDEPVPLAVLREAWLGRIDAAEGGGRFLAGGVTFCTLMPLRAVPFEVVALLGMNDGDYPRRSSRSDFDLMGLPGQARPGDRARRDDDRYLILEALLSARRVLHISWRGRSVRDNTAQPPSVLVSQLRDYLAAGWRGEPGDAPLDLAAATRLVLAPRTTVHPLQPFSRRYFTAGSGLHSWAAEWHGAHGVEAPAPLPLDGLPPDPGGLPAQLTVAELARFVRNPVREFFRRRLDVRFAEDEPAPADDESFGLNGLDDWQLLQALMDNPPEPPQPLPADAAAATAAAAEALAPGLAHLRGTGRLPIGPLGERAARQLLDDAVPMLRHWWTLSSGHGRLLPPQPLRLTAEDTGVVALQDWLEGLRRHAGTGAGAAGDVVLALNVSCLTLERGKADLKPGQQPSPRADKLVEPYVRLLVAAACGLQPRLLLVARDALLVCDPLPTDEAQPRLLALLQAWRSGLAAPLPVPLRTALAWISAPAEVQGAYEGTEGGREGSRPGERDEPCLGRVYPDFASLAAAEIEGRGFNDWVDTWIQPLQAWVNECVRAQAWPAADGDLLDV